MADVLAESFPGLLHAVLEILGVARAQVSALEVSHEDALEVGQRVDAIRRKVFDPGSHILCQVEGQELNDEGIIVRPTHAAHETEILQPYARVGVPRVFDDVGRRAESR